MDATRPSDPLTDAPRSPSVSIRPLAPSDAPALYALVLAQGADLDAFAWRARIDSEQAELAFIDWAALAESRSEAFARAIIVDGRLAGCASLYRPHPGSFGGLDAPTLQAGYWVDRAKRGHGAGWRAAALLMEQVADAMPPGSTVGIRARSRNAASLACAARLGLAKLDWNPPSMFDPSDTDSVLVGPLRAARPTATARAKRPR